MGVWDPLVVLGQFPDRKSTIYPCLSSRSLKCKWRVLKRPFEGSFGEFKWEWLETLISPDFTFTSLWNFLIVVLAVVYNRQSFSYEKSLNFSSFFYFLIGLFFLKSNQICFPWDLISKGGKILQQNMNIKDLNFFFLRCVETSFHLKTSCWFFKFFL